MSDFDLVVVFDSPDPRTFYDQIRPGWGSLKRYLPLNDLSILTVGEFEQWQRIGGGWDPLDEVWHWTLQAGEELRGDKPSIPAEAAALDRMAWALGHFQNLMQVAIKEEQRSRFMAIIARRQLHKCFWSSVLALDAKYLAIRTRDERIVRWIEDHGTPEPVAELQSMYQRQFLSGPVTVTRFAAAALAWRLIDESLQTNSLLARPLRRPPRSADVVPIGNHDEMEERAQAMCASVREIMEEKILSVILGSSGSARGYALYIILRDGLSQQELAVALGDIRAIHRVFDDLWYNEHLPGGIPTVCSRAMFAARLQTGRSSLHYFEHFRRVLFGPDLYEEAVSQTDSARLHSQESVREPDWRREQLVYSMHLHQVYLRRLKPALYEYVTFYLPRLVMQRHLDSAPATAEEAVARYAALDGAGLGELPRQMMQRYQGKDLDFLLRNMNPDAFGTAWPLLCQGIYSGNRSA